MIWISNSAVHPARQKHVKVQVEHVITLKSWLSNADKLEILTIIWNTQRLFCLPSVLLSIAFTWSTLGLWRLHCEIFRTHCSVSVPAWDVSIILMCTSMSHTQDRLILTERISPHLCDVSVSQHTGMKSADIFQFAVNCCPHLVFLHCILQSCYIHFPFTIKSFSIAPINPSSMISFLNKKLWGLVLSSVQENQTVLVLGKGNDLAFHFHNSCLNYKWIWRCLKQPLISEHYAWHLQRWAFLPSWNLSCFWKASPSSVQSGHLWNHSIRKPFTAQDFSIY